MRAETPHKEATSKSLNQKPIAPVKLLLQIFFFLPGSKPFAKNEGFALHSTPTQPQEAQADNIMSPRLLVCRKEGQFFGHRSLP